MKRNPSSYHHFYQTENEFIAKEVYVVINSVIKKFELFPFKQQLSRLIDNWSQEVVSKLARNLICLSGAKYSLYFFLLFHTESLRVEVLFGLRVDMICLNIFYQSNGLKLTFETCWIQYCGLFDWNKWGPDLSNLLRNVPVPFIYSANKRWQILWMRWKFT